MSMSKACNLQTMLNTLQVECEDWMRCERVNCERGTYHNSMLSWLKNVLNVHTTAVSNCRRFMMIKNRERCCQVEVMN